MQQKDITAEKLTNEVLSLINTDGRLLEMAKHAVNCSKNDALNIISKSILV